MTPAARLQAAIELLDAIIASVAEGRAAADTLIADYFRTRRYAGSKDRRAVRTHVYAAIRAYAEPPAGGRAAMIGLAARDPDLAALFDGSTHAPALIAEGDAGTAPSTEPIPGWLQPYIPDLLDANDRTAILARAPLHVRVNGLKADRSSVMNALPGAVRLEGTSNGLALPEGTALEQTDIWRDGLVEVQDKGSQIIAAACRAQPGQTVLDLCAGAGGKTLALAADMKAQGRLIAADVNRDRLSRLSPRAARADADFIQPLLLDAGREANALTPLAGQCDCVLVDAPCSGMGTWRRNPEARWRLTPAMLDRMTALQAHVLDLAAPMVKPGGALVYAVCSLLHPEGAAQLDTFLARHSGWRIDTLSEGRAHGNGRLLTPSADGTDGFFVARLVKA